MTKLRTHVTLIKDIKVKLSLQQLEKLHMAYLSKNPIKFKNVLYQVNGFERYELKVNSKKTIKFTLVLHEVTKA